MHRFVGGVAVKKIEWKVWDDGETLRRCVDVDTFIDVRMEGGGIEETQRKLVNLVKLLVVHNVEYSSDQISPEELCRALRCDDDHYEPSYVDPEDE